MSPSLKGRVYFIPHKLKGSPIFGGKHKSSLKIDFDSSNQAPRGTEHNAKQIRSLQCNFSEKNKENLKIILFFAFWSTMVIFGGFGRTNWKNF